MCNTLKPVHSQAYVFVKAANHKVEVRAIPVMETDNNKIILFRKIAEVHLEVNPSLNFSDMLRN